MSRREAWEIKRARSHDPARGSFNVRKGLGTKAARAGRTK